MSDDFSGIPLPRDLFERVRRWGLERGIGAAEAFRQIVETGLDGAAPKKKKPRGQPEVWADGRYIFLSHQCDMIRHELEKNRRPIDPEITDKAILKELKKRAPGLWPNSVQSLQARLSDARKRLRAILAD